MRAHGKRAFVVARARVRHSGTAAGSENPGEFILCALRAPLMLRSASPARFKKKAPPAARARLRAPAVLLASLLACAGTARADDLTSLSLEQLLEVKVVGASKYEQSQREVAAAVSVITRAEIQAFGWRTIDQALASLPGIYATYDRQYNYIGTRGFSVPGDFSTRVLVTVNGNRWNDPVFDGGPMGLQLPLDADLIERIEFIPGPGGAVYGQNAMFGVVNIVTRNGSDLNGTEVAARWQHPQAARELRLSWGRRLDSGMDLLLSASVQRTRGEDRFFEFGDSPISGVAKGLDGARDKELFVRAVRGPWSFDLAYGEHVKDDPTGAYFSDPLVPDQYQGDGYVLSQMQYQDRVADGKLDLLARAFAGRERYRSALSYEGAFFDFPADGHWHGLELRLLWLAVENHKLMLGAEAQKTTRQEQAILDRADPANDIVIADSAWRGGVYLQDEWRLSPVLTATLGLRADRNNATGTSTSPRAALIWQATPASTVKALYGRAHRAPNAYERDYDDGFAQIANPALRGERIDTFELVLDHRVGADLALRGSAYRWTMHDLITLGIEPVSGIAQYQSGSRVEARGLELGADKTWRNGARLRGSVSWHDVSDADGADLLNSPRLLGRLNASMPLPWWGLNAGYELRYDGSRLTNAGSRVGGHAVSGLMLTSKALGRGLELGLRIDNLFDKRFEHPGADSNPQNTFEQDGRSLRLQAAWRF
jgi:outer membrane cobalamin receptor